MAVNYSSEQNSTVSVSDQDTPFVLHRIIIHYLQFALTVATFLYGITSWCIIRKFRNFNNYVYLNTILVNIFRLTIVSITKMHYNETLESFHQYFIFMFFSTVFNYWLLQICYMFYVDIVKIFGGGIKRKFLKSFLFAWGIPLIGLIVFSMMLLIIQLAVKGDKEKIIILIVIILAIVTSYFIPLIINVIVFLKIIRSLFFNKDKSACVVSEKERRKENRRRFLTATTMFMLTNVNVLILIMWGFFKTSFSLRGVTFVSQTVVLSLYVPLVKSNRTLWYEYHVNRISRTIS